MPSCEARDVISDAWKKWVFNNRSLVYSGRGNTVSGQRPISRGKPRKLFGSVKPFSVNLYVREVYTLETSCIKGTSVHITNVWINQPCNHKIWDFARLSGCKNFSGPSRNGPQTRFWVYADYPFRILDQSDLPDLTGSPRFADIRTSGVWLSKMFLFLVTDQRDRGFWGLQWENRN